MTVILRSYQVQNVTIEQYWEKYSLAAFWRVRKDNRVIRKGLMNKPTGKQIQGYLNN